MEDIRLALMCGLDIPVLSIQQVIHQPKIKEIALIGEDVFFTGIQCFNIDKDILNQNKNYLQNTNNFQIFITMMLDKQARDKKKSVELLLSLLFPNYKAVFTPRSILMQGGINFIIDESNFDEFQEICKSIFCINNGKNDQQRNFNPANEKAREIAEKIMRGRQRVAKIKGTDNNSIFSQYLSILTVGLPSMSLQDLMELTMYQLYDLIERYQLYVKWDIDIRSRLAGGKSDEHPENWMKNIH